MEAKKGWQITLVAILGLVIVGLVGFGTYYLVSNSTTTEVAQQPSTQTAPAVAKTTDDQQLDQIQTDLNQDSDLDTTQLNQDLNDLNSIDLSGV